MDDRLRQLESAIAAHGPYRDEEILAVNAAVAIAQEGSKTRAAIRLGITRYTLRGRLRAFRKLAGQKTPEN